GAEGPGSLGHRGHRTGSARGRAHGGRAGAPPGARRAPVHARRTRLRRLAGTSGAAPRGAVLREGGGDQGTRARRLLAPAHRGRRRGQRPGGHGAPRLRRRAGSRARGARRGLADPHARDGGRGGGARAV
ncbi:MAG: Holo-[acyl-carrier protein] synthase, partial [uncultured Solirubrobacteraceae bacterium]